MALKTGDRVTLHIDKISSDGSGIARHDDGMIVFVPGALPGETVGCTVSVKKREYAIAYPADVLSPHPQRARPFCPLYGVCGGCQLQHAAYALQCELKKSMVEDAFTRIYKKPFPPVSACIPSPAERGYRNKASLPVRREKGRIVPGFYRRRSHEVIPVTDCPVLAPKVNTALGVMAEVLPTLGLAPYDEKTARGLLRHLIVRQAQATGDLLLSVVLSRKIVPGEREVLLSKLLPPLLKALPELRSLTANYNPKAGNVIAGPETEVLYGDGLVKEILPPYAFEYDTTAFFQINTLQAIELYKEAAALAVRSEKDSILELYSGIGTLTAFLAAPSSHVTAVEEWPSSVLGMKKNMEANGLHNRVTILSGAVEDHIASLSAPFDGVVVDPPRTGCSEKVLQGIAALSPERIVYVSCNPATLARDGASLHEKGYLPRKITCFDMFPQTSHVETIVLMSRVENGVSGKA